MGWPICQAIGCKRRARRRVTVEHGHSWELCRQCFEQMLEGYAVPVRVDITIKEVVGLAKLEDQGG